MIAITLDRLESEFDTIMENVIDNEAVYYITGKDGKNPVVLMPYGSYMNDSDD